MNYRKIFYICQRITLLVLTLMAIKNSISIEVELILAVVLLGTHDTSLWSEPGWISENI